jgi:hypothetical protein
MISRPAHAIRKAGLASLFILAAVTACGPTETERAARNASAGGAGEPAGNLITPPDLIETSSPEIANTAEASALESRARGMATPRERAEGSVGGPGAPDTSGRAHQERVKDR